MKTPSLTKAIAWIALNESNGDPGRLDPRIVAWYMVSVLVADLFGLTPQEIGRRVVEYRLHQDQLKDL